MKILLVQTLWRRVEKPIYPLGLAYIAAALKDRHQVHFLDENMCQDSGAILLEHALKLQPDVIGFSMRNVDSIGYADFIIGTPSEAFSTARHIGQLVRTLKQNLPNTIMVIGGPAFSIFPQRVMEVVPELDFGVIGSGEWTFPLLLDNLNQPDNVPGIFYRKNSTIVHTGHGTQIPFPQLPDPDHDVVDVKPYLDIDQPDTIGIQTKRGCSLNCAYCIYPFLEGKKIRQRDPKLVVDEIETLVNRYNLTHFQFADSVFNHPQQHAEAICNEMIRRNLLVEWSAWYDVKTLNESFLKTAVKAGCRVFELSPDGYANRILRELGKSFTRKDIIRVCRIARRIPGVQLRLNFLANTPSENIFHLLRMIGFFIRLKLFYRGKVELLALNFIRIFPNTAIYRRALQEGVITQDQELLPLDPSDLIKTYYRPHPGSLSEKIYALINHLQQWRRIGVGRCCN